MKQKLYEITKQGKDYGKFCYVVKIISADRFRVTTIDGFRTVCSKSELREIY